MEQEKPLEPVIVENHNLPVKRSEEEIYNILAQAMNKDTNIFDVALEHGVTVETIRSWYARYKDDIRLINEVTRQQVSTLMLHRSKELISGVTKEKIDKATVRDIAIAAGIFADKHMQLGGNQGSNQSTTLRLAWDGGKGAIELNTSQK